MSPTKGVEMKKELFPKQPEELLKSYYSGRGFRGSLRV
jgi:hypothetical protein